jgi:hypothetical protein
VVSLRRLLSNIATSSCHSVAVLIQAFKRVTTVVAQVHDVWQETIFGMTEYVGEKTYLSFFFYKNRAAIVSRFSSLIPY